MRLEPLEPRLLLANVLPVITWSSASPYPVTKGGTLTLTAGGVSDGDGTILAVEFHRDSNSSGTLDAGDVLLGQGDNAFSNVWVYSLSTAALPVGNMQVLAVAVDNKGGKSTPAVIPVNIAGVGPTLGWVSVSPSTLSNGGQVTLTAHNVIDADGVGQVEFFLDVNNDSVLQRYTGDLLLAASTTASGNNYSWTGPLTGLPLGNIRLLAVGRDTEGNYGGVATTTATVFNAPPTLSGFVAQITESQFSLTVQATDPDNGIAAVDFYRDVNGDGLLQLTTDVHLGRGTNEKGSTWNIFGSRFDLPLGEVKFLAIAEDGTGLKSAVATTTAAVANLPPVITSFSADLVGDSVQVGAVVADPDSTVSRLAVYRDTDGDAVLTSADQHLGGAALAAGTWLLGVDRSTLGLGTHRLLAQAVDSAGAHSGGASTLIHLDNRPPTIDSLTGQIIEGQLRVEAAAADPDTETPVATVTIYRDADGDGLLSPLADALLGHAELSAGLWRLSIHESGVPEGQSVLLALAEDSAGLAGAVASATVTRATADPPPTDPPPTDPPPTDPPPTDPPPVDPPPTDPPPTDPPPTDPPPTDPPPTDPPPTDPPPLGETPGPVISSGPVQLGGEQTDIVVRFPASMGLDAATLSRRTLLVHSPGGAEFEGLLLSVEIDPGTQELISTWRLPAPAGLWGPGDAGRYTLTLLPALGTPPGEAGGQSIDLPALDLAMQPDLAGNYRSAALNTGYWAIGRAKNFFEYVDATDIYDVYRLRVTEPMRLTALVNGLTDQARIQLLHQNGLVLRTTNSPGVEPRTFTRFVKPGTYYIRVQALFGGGTAYRLRVTTAAQAALPSSPPAAMSTSSLFSDEVIEPASLVDGL